MFRRVFRFLRRAPRLFSRPRLPLIHEPDFRPLLAGSLGGLEGATADGWVVLRLGGTVAMLSPDTARKYALKLWRLAQTARAEAEWDELLRPARLVP